MTARFRSLAGTKSGHGWFIFAVLLMGLLVFSPAANAAFLVACIQGTGAGGSTAPGDTVNPCFANGATAGTLLASLSVPFVSSLGTSAGTLISAVYRNPSGTLDFYYQVIENATAPNCGHTGQPACDPISRETDTTFTGFLTQLDFRTDCGTMCSTPGFTNGTVAPITGDRNSPVGDVIGFSFFPPDASKIQPGTTSNVLIISTNATMFTAGNASVIDGGVTTVASFQPTMIPEPGSLALIGGGLLALAGIRRRIARR